MRRATRCLLWLFVFSMPWDVVALPAIGTISRLLGIAAVGAGVLTTVAETRFRRPGVIFWLALAFTVSSVLSLFWTISDAATLGRAWTYAQLLGIVWIVWEFARTGEDQQSLLVAFSLGAFVPVADLLRNFNAGVPSLDDIRYSAGGFNANDLGLTLVLGIPMAWQLLLNCRGAVRFMASIYCLVAPVGVLLTGSRAAFLAGIVAVSIIPLTLPRRSLRSFLTVSTVLVVAAAATLVVVPAQNWARILTIQQEIGVGGTFTGRVDIWRAGWSVFLERPVLGVGAGAFESAVNPLLNAATASHNVPLAVLVEQGIVGFAIFAALLGACAWIVVGLPPPERKLWSVLMLSWLVGVMSLSWQYRKLTWLLFGLLAAQGAAVMGRRQGPNHEESGVRDGARRTFVRRPEARGATQLS